MTASLLRAPRLLAVLMCINHISAAAAGPVPPVSSKYRDVARCFFVYAALNESARTHARPELESYAIQRLMWVRGFSEALNADPVWKSEFEAGDLENNELARSIVRRVSAAVAAGSVRDYNTVIAEGEACDLRLGLVRSVK